MTSKKVEADTGMGIKNFIKKAVVASKLLRLKSLDRPVVILFYHSIGPSLPERARHVTPGITLSPELFREHMRLLRKCYQPISLEQVPGRLDGNFDPGPRPVVVTFDDGFEDNYEYAAPIMEEFDIRGTFYLTTGCVEHRTLPWFCKTWYLFEKAKEAGTPIVLESFAGDRTWNLSIPEEHRAAWLHYGGLFARATWEKQFEILNELESALGFRYDDAGAPRMMTWEQARELADRGHLIGDHTFSHANVAHLTEEDCRTDLDRSHRLLTERMGKPAEHFSFPHPCLRPQYDEFSLSRVRELGYQTAVLTSGGPASRGMSPWTLPRVTMEGMDADAFLWKIETAFAGIET